MHRTERIPAATTYAVVLTFSPWYRLAYRLGGVGGYQVAPSVLERCGAVGATYNMKGLPLASAMLCGNV